MTDLHDTVTAVMTGAAALVTAALAWLAPE